jgi:hypothetical protein
VRYDATVPASTTDEAIARLRELANADVAVSVFRCCTGNGGEYLGGRRIHNPDEPWEGPWYVLLRCGEDVVADVGFGTRDAALTALERLRIEPINIIEAKIRDPYPDRI